MTLQELLSIHLPNIRSPSEQKAEEVFNIPNALPSLKDSTHSASTQHNNLKGVLDWPTIDNMNFNQLLERLKTLIGHCDLRINYYKLESISEGETVCSEPQLTSTLQPVLNDVFSNRIFSKLGKKIKAQESTSRNNIDLHWIKM